VVEVEKAEAVRVVAGLEARRVAQRVGLDREAEAVMEADELEAEDCLEHTMSQTLSIPARTGMSREEASSQRL